MKAKRMSREARLARLRDATKQPLLRAKRAVWQGWGS
jgi:hypothetical protein